MLHRMGQKKMFRGVFRQEKESMKVLMVTLQLCWRGMSLKIVPVFGGSTLQALLKPSACWRKLLFYLFGCQNTFRLETAICMVPAV